MANIILRLNKGTPITNAEMDANLSALNNDLVAHIGSSGGSHGVATQSVSGFMASADKTKLDGIDFSANNYSLPTASTTVLGGVKVDGTTITITDGVIKGLNQYVLPTASTTVLGGVKVDGTTITISNGVIGVTGTVTNATNSVNSTNATYLSATQQNQVITGKQSSLVMAKNNATTGSFVAKATGTGDSNLAGLTFANDAYSIKMGVRSDGYFGIGGGSRDAWSWYSDPSGNMVAVGDISAYSDERLKEDFKKIQNPLDIICKLDGGSFTWKTGFAHTDSKAGKKDYGVLANQVKSVLPELINESIELDGETYKTVAYIKLIPFLIESVKALKEENDILRRDIELLKND